MILRKHQCHIRLLTTNKSLGLLRGIDGLRDNKVFRLRQTIDGLLCLG